MEMKFKQEIGHINIPFKYQSGTVNIRRRNFLNSAMSLSLGALSSAVFAQASDFPSKPIRIVVPYTPGGADTQMRSLGRGLIQRLGQQVVIESVPGAGGIIASNQIKNSVPDGYTLYFTGTATLTMLPVMRKDLTFGLSDFSPIGNITGTAGAVVVRPDPAWRDLREFVAWAKANPRKVNLGTAGAGTLTHIYGAAFQAMADIQFTHIPFKGVADAVAAMLAGNVDIVMGLPGVMINHIRAGKLRAIATFGGSRSEFLPDVPTLKESGIDFVDIARFGLFAPKGLPKLVQNKLALALEQEVKSQDFAALMNRNFTSVLYHSPDEYRIVLEEESRHWSGLLNNPKFAEAMK